MNNTKHTPDNDILSRINENSRQCEPTLTGKQSTVGVIPTQKVKAKAQLMKVKDRSIVI